MHIQFSKMHSLGNDFVVIDNTGEPLNFTPEQIRALSDRHRGIGFDQILLAERPSTPAADFFYRIYNADGSEVAQCGNGARCLAKFVRDKGLTDKTTLVFETAAGFLQVFIDEPRFTVNMGIPNFDPAAIPLEANEQAPTYRFDIEQHTIELSALSLGNPHAVCLVSDVESAPVSELGHALSTHARFPERANVGFMQVIDRTHIRLRVYERGAGETLACGSGASAAVVAAYQRRLVDPSVTVSLPGGDLNVSWEGPDTPVRLTGPAEFVFNGWADYY